MDGRTLLPTSFVGSYPRPSWFTHQLAGRDIWDAFKQRAHQEAYEDAVRVAKDAIPALLQRWAMPGRWSGGWWTKHCGRSTRIEAPTPEQDSPPRAWTQIWLATLGTSVPTWSAAGLSLRP